MSFQEVAETLSFYLLLPYLIEMCVFGVHWRLHNAPTHLVSDYDHMLICLLDHSMEVSCLFVVLTQNETHVAQRVSNLLVHLVFRDLMGVLTLQ